MLAAMRLAPPKEVEDLLHKVQWSYNSIRLYLRMHLDKNNCRDTEIDLSKVVNIEQLNGNGKWSYLNVLT